MRRIVRFGGRPRGFSLMELLVSLAIMSVAVIGMAALFDRSNRMTKVEGSVTDSQQNVRYGSYQVVREARMAGAGTVPVSIGGVQIAVALSLGTSSYHSATAVKHLVNNMNASSDTVFISGTHHVRKGTDVLHIRGIISNVIYDLGSSSYDTSTGTLVIHSCTKFPDATTAVSSPCYPNGINDVSFFSTFSATQPRLFVVTDTFGNVGVAVLTAATVGTDSNGLANATLTLKTNNAYANSLNSLGSFIVTTPLRGGVLDDLIYFIDDGTASGGTCGTSNQTDSPGPCHPQLAVAQWSPGITGGTCTVSVEDPTACATVTPIADDIEDMQIAYGVDFRTMTCTGSGASLACTGTGTLAAPSVGDASISLTDATSFQTIVKTAYTASAPNLDPSEDTSATGKDEWVGNVTGEIAIGTFDYSSDLSLLKAIEVSILGKGTNPDPQFKGQGATAWSIMDSAAQLVSQQNGYAYHRRIAPVRVSLRNFQSQ